MKIFGSLLIFIAVIVSAYLSHRFTVHYYDNMANKKLQELNTKFVEAGGKVDAAIKGMSELERIFGVTYEHEDIKSNIDERFEKLKKEASKKLTKVKEKKITFKDSYPTGKPLANIYVTSKYGLRTHPITKKVTSHRGVDLRARMNTNVYATAPGVVNLVSYDRYYGHYIKIQHDMGFETVYAHLNKPRVKQGDVVKQGDIIALSGNSGRSTAPHLHYETKYGGQAIQPKIYK